MAVRITDEGESECRSVMERISVASATPTTSPDAKAGGLPFMALHTRELDCVPRVKGGSTGATNCVLLHPECHDRVHRQRLSVSKPRLL